MRIYIYKQISISIYNYKMIKLLLIFFLLSTYFLNRSNAITVSSQNLQAFFNSTYDTNQDGRASLQQFHSYFQSMQPQANFTKQDILSTFQIFDSNNDNYVTLSELISIARIKVGYRIGHKQIHIGFTANHDQMQIMWVSNPEKYSKPVVHYGRFPAKLNETAYAIVKSYNVGHLGFHGRIYKAILVGLEPNKRYYYKVGDLQTRTYSDIKYFKSRPLKGQQLSQVNFAVFGDMGTFVPFGHVVAAQIARDNFVKPYDFIFLTGDIAYAGISSQKAGELQPVWDLYGELTQPFAAFSPFIAGSGNHEKYYNFSAYHARYELPRQYPGQTNFWFSIEYGQVHFSYFSAEHSFAPGSQQYLFLETDLRNARQNPYIKWIIVGTHRPFYSSNQRQYSNQTSLARIWNNIVQNGHIHSYQRSWPLYKGKAQKKGHNQTHFNNPGHPIYVVQATAGALMYEKWVHPAPQYAIKRMNKYGYGRINVKGNILKYQFIQAPSGKVVDEWYITKQ